jgi:hypothetical protein
MHPDPTVGYYFAANQEIVRLGNRIHINAFHQRSKDVQLAPPAGTKRLLMVGDSVTFGGARVDQSETISAYLERLLRGCGDKAYQALNASAPSWGIGNVLAYLQKFGTFNSQVVLLQIGSRDLLQAKSDSNTLRHRATTSYERPWAAIGQVLSLHIIPRIKAALYGDQSRPTIKKKLVAQFSENLTYFKQAVNIVRGQGAAMIVLHTPTAAEVVRGAKKSGLRDYQLYRIRFLAKTKKLGVPVVNLVRKWRIEPEVIRWFRDKVHLTAEGNKAAARAIAHQSYIKNSCQRNSM